MLQMRKPVQPQSPTILPGKKQICSKCDKRGHYAKSCRSTNVNYLEDQHDEQQEEIETERSTETENDPVAFAKFTSKNG